MAYDYQSGRKCNRETRMIPTREIKEIARANGVPVTTIPIQTLVRPKYIHMLWKK